GGGVGDRARVCEFGNGDRRVHGCRDVDFPGSRRQKGRREEDEALASAKRFPATLPAMTLTYRAAVLHQARTPLKIEQVSASELAPADVLARVRAAGLCHTDLEVIDGSLRYPMPIVP